MLTHLLHCSLLLIGLCPLAGAQGVPSVLEKILDEGKNNSQVWRHLMYLSEEIGPPRRSAERRVGKAARSGGVPVH